jgi:N-acetyl-gamma-glutamyl-phosphate reductase
LAAKPSSLALSRALEDHYRDSAFVSALPMSEAGARPDRLEPESLNGTNDMQLRVFSNEKHQQAVLVAKFDNLGKGASGAAVQNLKLMLGL